MKQTRKDGMEGAGSSLSQSSYRGDGVSGNKPCVDRGRITEADGGVSGDAPAAPSILSHILQDTLEK